MLFALFLLTLVIAYTLSFYRSLSKYPKGPTPLPLIGNIHQVAFQTWRAGGVTAGFDVFRREFGKVFTLWLGPLPTVYIGDYDVAHESHVRRANVFGTRYTTGGMEYNREGRGLLMSNGQFWQDHRRFALQTLRNFGLGRNIMEERIMKEFNYRMQDFQRTHFVDGAIEVYSGTFCDLLVGSIINTLLTSKRFEQDDKEFEQLKNDIATSFESFTLFDTLCPLWLLKSWIMKWRTPKIMAPLNHILELSRRTVEQRVAAIESGEHVIDGEGDDFIDAFLVKIEKDRKEGIETSFNLETLVIDVYDLWIGGQETTSTTLIWAFACLLNHPEVVKEMRSELLRVTGGDRNVSLSDKTQTHYLNAVIHEIQRIASILNLNFFRDIAEDTVVDGQLIAAGSKITTQMSLIHTDADLFKDHTQFRPERFLENNNLDKKLIPFGIGKRACPGESLARTELYLIIGNTILNYDLEPVGNVPEIKTVAPFSILNRAPHYNIRFVPIHNE